MDKGATRAPGSPEDLIGTAERWLSDHGKVAIATVLSTWGSAPVPAGSQMVVAPDDGFEGSVSGGCIEAAVITAAAEVMQAGAPRIVSYGVSHQQALDVGLPCGGTVEILIEGLEASAHTKQLSEIRNAIADRRTIGVATDLTNGARALVSTLDSVPESAQRILATGGVYRNGNAAAEPAATVYKAYAPSVRLFIIGAVQLAQYLTRMAQTAGLDVTVIDPRTAFASEERFPGINLDTRWPAEALADLACDEHTAIAVLSHQAQIDDEALKAALATSAYYIGALGSRRTHAARVDRLQSAGLADEEIARIDAPIGLDIGAVGPAEIAVSILSGVISAQRTPRRKQAS